MSLSARPADSPAFILVDEQHWQQSARRKARERAALAALDPRQAQALVSSMPAPEAVWRDVTPPGRWQLGEDAGGEHGL